MKPNNREVAKFLHDKTDAELENGLAELANMGDGIRNKFDNTLTPEEPQNSQIPTLPSADVDHDLGDDSLIRGIPTEEELDDDFKQAA